MRVPVIVLLCLLLTGCGNPFLVGYTGDRLDPLPDEMAVLVYGANRNDRVAIDLFNRRLNLARQEHRLLGTATIVSASSLRDQSAADAGREVGATSVYYSFAYLDSTVERQTTERYYDSPNSEYERFERRSSDTTKHWYEYRAYFFGDGPPMDAEE